MNPRQQTLRRRRCWAAVTVLSGALAGCVPPWISPPLETGPIDVRMDDDLNVTETMLTGVVDDPLYGDAGFDLSSRPVTAKARFIGTRSDEIEIRVEPGHVPTVGSNNVILRLSIDGDSVTAAGATLIQAADTFVYDCEPMPANYEYDYCHRTLPAAGGELRLTPLPLDDPGEAMIVGSFEFDTDAGRVSGTFVVERIGEG